MNIRQIIYAPKLRMDNSPAPTIPLFNPRILETNFQLGKYLTHLAHYSERLNYFFVKPHDRCKQFAIRTQLSDKGHIILPNPANPRQCNLMPGSKTNHKEPFKKPFPSKTQQSHCQNLISTQNPYNLHPSILSHRHPPSLQSFKNFPSLRLNLFQLFILTLRIMDSRSTLPPSEYHERVELARQWENNTFTTEKRKADPVAADATLELALRTGRVAREKREGCREKSEVCLVRKNAVRNLVRRC